LRYYNPRNTKTKSKKCVFEGTKKRIFLVWLQRWWKTNHPRKTNRKKPLNGSNGKKGFLLVGLRWAGLAANKTSRGGGSNPPIFWRLCSRNSGTT
jgi:hypothetical protein